jgi:uncharacterized protein
MSKIFINRDIAQYIQELDHYYKVITVTGPRQSGKTTLIRHLYPDYAYFSLEDLDIRRIAKDDPRGFLDGSSKGMILDEIQNVPELLSYIQGIVDADSERRFILSGSSQFSMMKKVSQSLAGRTAIVELMPMSYNELRDTLEEKNFDTFLFDGFYPAICSNANKPEFFYPNYVKTYLERDVRDMLAIKDLLQFETFLRLCAGRIGSLFNASQLAGEVGVSVNTIKSWLSVLQASYIITLLQPYYANSSKRLIKTPKLYFWDTGLACYLLGINSPSQLNYDKMRGPLFENFIIAETLKSKCNTGSAEEISFYRDGHQNEVDLIIKKDGLLTAVEIKSAQTYHPDFQKGINAFASNFGSLLRTKAVVYAGDIEHNGDFKLLNYKHLSSIL